MNSNSEMFLDLYNKLDDYMRKVLDFDEKMPHSDIIHNMAKRSNIFKRHRDDLLACGRLRNAIVHDPKRKDTYPIAEPHDYMVDMYRKLYNDLMNPPKAYDEIAVTSIYTAALDDYAIDVMKEMNEKVYTHVPVIKDGVLIGVFSENTLLSYMVKMGDVILEKEVKINEFIEFLPIEKHTSEYFTFVPKDSMVVDIEELFKEELQKNKRLAAVFITENGKSTETIIGMVTPWDVAGNRNE